MNTLGLKIGSWCLFVYLVGISLANFYFNQGPEVFLVQFFHIPQKYLDLVSKGHVAFTLALAVMVKLFPRGGLFLMTACFIALDLTLNIIGNTLMTVPIHGSQYARLFFPLGLIFLIPSIQKDGPFLGGKLGVLLLSLGLSLSLIFYGITIWNGDSTYYSFVKKLIAMQTTFHISDLSSFLKVIAVHNILLGLLVLFTKNRIFLMYLFAFCFVYSVYRVFFFEVPGVLEFLMRSPFWGTPLLLLSYKEQGTKISQEFVLRTAS